MVGGQSYRVGQIGAYLRIPLGYTHLYGTCTQVGADAVPESSASIASQPLERDLDPRMSGYRWLTLALFGEAVGGHFERGIGQYPTVGDEVHLVTAADLGIIYGGSRPGADGISIGRIADSDGLRASLRISALVSRHSSVVGSTGSGKSNLVAVLLSSITGGRFPGARVLVIDPHGEYADALGPSVHTLSSDPQPRAGSTQLRVPYWALPLDQLLELTMGPLQPGVVESIRERVRDLKLLASKHLARVPPEAAVTADSPIPFSIRRLWFELEDVERATFSVSNGQTEEKRLARENDGNAADLKPPLFPPAAPYNQAPYFNRQRKNISRQLDMLRSRLLDPRYAFMFDSADQLHPDLDGRVGQDLASLVESWIGHDAQATVVDVSAIPSEVSSTVVGTMMQIIYDTLFWATGTSVGGRHRPLLTVIDEAHRFFPSSGSGLATRVFSKIAKEGRKYGVGLMVVTQRPSDVDSGILSQCGTMIALRVTSPSDKAAVAAVVPDDLGGLISLIPSLRTGEALVLGEAMSVPSRVRIDEALHKPTGSDPDLPAAWLAARHKDSDAYAQAVDNWRAQSTAGHAVPVSSSAVLASEFVREVPDVAKTSPAIEEKET